jgi:hypothetical protein
MQLLAYTIDHTRAEVSIQGQHIAWTDRWRYSGQTRWMPATVPDPRDPDTLLGAHGLWVLHGQTARAPLMLASPRPRAYRTGDRVSLWPSPQALELGLWVQWGLTSGTLYLQAPHDVWIPPQMTLLQGVLHKSLPSRIESAVRLLRQAGLPASAEELLSAQGRLCDVVADVQRALSAAADRERPMPSPLLTWAEVGAVVGEVLE